MLIIWGFKTVAQVLGITTMVCGRCGNPAAHRVEKLVRKFTLFWIPLFPIRKQTVITCAFCGVTHEVPKGQVPQLMSALESPVPGQSPDGRSPDGRPGGGYPGQHGGGNAGQQGFRR